MSPEIILDLSAGANQTVTRKFGSRWTDEREKDRGEGRGGGFVFCNCSLHHDSLVSFYAADKRLHIFGGILARVYIFLI